mgnify:CR=1 FL=1
MPYKDPEEQRACARRHYAKHRKAYLQRNVDRKHEARTYIAELKSTTPCADCGEKYPSYVMDFDHLDGSTKDGDVATLAGNGHTLARIKREIEKCEIVCSNCHRERTHQRKQSRVV